MDTRSGLECKSGKPSDVPDSQRLQALPASKANNFSFRRKVSSIISAKVLSIMPADAGAVTSD
jgi:hypothetical protein